MKKIFSLLFVLCVSMALLCACGSTNNEQTDSNDKLDIPYLNMDLEKYIKVADYSDFNFDEPDIRIMPDEIESKVQDVLRANAQIKTVFEGKVENKDEIEITYVGYVNGAETIAEQTKTLTIGNGDVSKEIEESLIGKNIGDDTVAYLTVSEDNSNGEELIGEEIEYRIKINKKNEYIYPELTEDFAKNVAGYESVADMKQKLEEEVYNQKKIEKYSAIFTEKWNQILEESEVIEYPQEEFASEKEYFLAYVYDNGLDTGEEDPEALAEEYAERFIKQQLVIYAISEELDLVPSKSEYREYLLASLEQNGMTEQDFYSYFQEDIIDYALEFDLVSNYLLNKFMEHLMGIE